MTLHKVKVTSIFFNKEKYIWELNWSLLMKYNHYFHLHTSVVPKNDSLSTLVTSCEDHTFEG